MADTYDDMGSSDAGGDDESMTETYDDMGSSGAGGDDESTTETYDDMGSSGAGGDDESSSVDESSYDDAAADDISYDGGFSAGEGGSSSDPDEGGYSPAPPISDDGGYSSDPESGGSSSAYDVEGGMSTNPLADGGYSSAPPADSASDQSEWSPYILPEVTVEGEPSSTYTMPEVTVEGEPNPWVDPATGAETDPMTGTVTFPADNISGPGGAPGHGYDGPSIGPLSPEDAERGAEAWKEHLEYEKELHEWANEPFEGTHEIPEKIEPPEVVFD